MKDKIKSIIKKIDDSPILFLLSVAVGVLLLGGGFITLMYCISLASGGEMGNSFSDTIRNFAWVFSMWATVTGGIFGLRLAWRGRQIQQRQWETQEGQRSTQHTSNLQERYEKAADMLSSELEATRLAACVSLFDLGTASDSMKIPCVRLLFAFIKNPPLKNNEKDKSFENLFPADKPLRSDIQEAITSFSKIHEVYDTDRVDDQPVKLPKYFWQNKRKGNFSLANANLNSAEMSGASLVGVGLQYASLVSADLREANLWKVDLQNVDLRNANLHGAKLDEVDLRGSNLQNAKLHGAILLGVDFLHVDLRNAILSGASMQTARNLTKEQILSAWWGSSSRIKKNNGVPQLPSYLYQDEDINEWLKDSSYGDKKKPEDSE